MWPPRIMANDQEESTNDSAGPDRDAPAAGIDQIGIGAVRRRQRANTDHAILRLNEDVDLRAQIVGDKQRHTQTQIDEHAVGDVLGGAPRNLQTVQRRHTHGVTVTTRST